MTGSTSRSTGAWLSLRVALGLALALTVAMVLIACAVMEPPPGGPRDVIRPHVETMFPDSASTGLAGVNELQFTFSEKMDRVSAVTWLHFFPDQRIDDTRWHGATRADIVLAEPLPPDTVVVVEIAAGMADAHKVKNRRGRRFPIATGDHIPTGKITGVLVMADSAVTNGVVELYAVPPDTLEYFEQSILRRTVTDKTGTYVFDWLPVPGGPWLARAYADANSDLRPGENEAQRLLPDMLSLALDRALRAAGVSTLYAPDTPGRLLISPFDALPLPGQIMAWSMRVTEEDTGWVPATMASANYALVDAAIESTVPEVKPGINRLVMFVDVDADSTFSGVSTAQLPAQWQSFAATDGDSVVTHYLEPWLMIEELEILPGLDTPITVPAIDLTLTPWSPPVVSADSLTTPAAAESDSTREGDAP